MRRLRLRHECYQLEHNSRLLFPHATVHLFLSESKEAQTEPSITQCSQLPILRQILQLTRTLV